MTTRESKSMLIGLPWQIKNNEHRIGLTPAGARELVDQGNQVMVERNGGVIIGFEDGDYRNAGAEIVDTPAEIFTRAEMIIKVKEPQPEECRMLRPGQVLFTYLHLAPDPEQTRLLVGSGETHEERLRDGRCSH
jgi:alanine dehydrogenase